MTDIKIQYNAKNNNELRKLIALQVRKQIDVILCELLSLEDELAVK